MASNQIGHPSTETPQPPQEARPELRDSGQPRMPPELTEANVTSADVDTIAYVIHECIAAWRRAKGSFELQGWSLMPGEHRNMIRKQVIDVMQGEPTIPGALNLGYIERRLFKEIVRHLDPRARLD